MTLLVLLVAIAAICGLAAVAFVSSRQSAREEALQREVEHLRHSLEASLARREADVRRLAGVIIETMRNGGEKG